MMKNGALRKQSVPREGQVPPRVAGNQPRYAHPMEDLMAKIDRTAARKVGKVMHEFKEGTLKSGTSGAPVRSRKQAIAIGLSEARQQGAKVPARRRATGT
jgi:hypothetical protein